MTIIQAMDIFNLSNVVTEIGKENTMDMATLEILSYHQNSVIPQKHLTQNTWKLLFLWNTCCLQFTAIEHNLRKCISSKIISDVILLYFSSNTWESNNFIFSWFLPSFLSQAILSVAMEQRYWKLCTMSNHLPLIIIHRGAGLLFLITWIHLWLMVTSKNLSIMHFRLLLQKLKI